VAARTDDQICRLPCSSRPVAASTTLSPQQPSLHAPRLRPPRCAASPPRRSSRRPRPQLRFDCACNSKALWGDTANYEGLPLNPNPCHGLIRCLRQPTLGAPRQCATLRPKAAHLTYSGTLQPAQNSTFAVLLTRIDWPGDRSHAHAWEGAVERPPLSSRRGMQTHLGVRLLSFAFQMPRCIRGKRP